jgi:hypothetical protein
MDLGGIGVQPADGVGCRQGGNGYKKDAGGAQADHRWISIFTSSSRSEGTRISKKLELLARRFEEGSGRIRISGKGAPEVGVLGTSAFQGGLIYGFMLTLRQRRSNSKSGFGCSPSAPW